MTKIPKTLFLALLFFACSSSGTSSGGTTTSGHLTDVSSWIYQLENIDTSAIGDSNSDLAVVDYSSDGDESGEFTSAEVMTMKGSNEKLLIAYLSIGEAEDYRYYFDASAAYMDVENPDWPGNFKVFYWEDEWQTVIEDYLDRIIAAGFDGAYLDIIDAYEYYGPGGDSGLDRTSAADDMTNFVIALAEHARETNPDFIIIPQNGSGIINDASNSDEYLATIDGIGAEDTFYNGDEEENNELNVQDDVVDNLSTYLDEGKTVLAIDYVTEDDLIDDFYSRCNDAGYIPYTSVRNLDALTYHDGLDP